MSSDRVDDETATPSRAPMLLARAGRGGWRDETSWREAEDWLVQRAERLRWWDAALWAAGHERTRPRLTVLALQSYATQAAGDQKQGYLQLASERLSDRAREALWSEDDLRPPAGIDPDSVTEVESAVVGVLTDALTAAVLTEELDRGVLPTRRYSQLLEAVTRSGLPGFEPDGRVGETGGTMPA